MSKPSITQRLGAAFARIASKRHFYEEKFRRLSEELEKRVRERTEQLRASEERYRNVVEQATEGVYLFEPETGLIREANPAYQRLLGYAEEELLEMTVYDVVAHDRENVDKGIRETISQSSHRLGERRHRRKDGSLVDVEVGAVVISQGDGRLVCAIVRDITERKRAEKEAREFARYSRNLFDVNLDALFTVDTEGRILDANPSMSAMTGVPREDLIGQDIFGFLPNADLDREEFEETLIRGYAQDYESTIRRSDGHLVPVLLNATVYHGEGGRIPGILTSARDMTEQNRLVQELERQALHDSLTGFPNRALLSDRLEQAVNRADEETGTVAVLYLDLDRFKVVNDSMGHSAGDRLLVESAGRLSECLGPGDTLARVGGDEFVVLLENVSDAGEAAIAANRLLVALRKPFEIEDQEVSVDASVGIALGKSSESGANLLRNADLAMYSAKRDKRSDYAVFDPVMNAQAQARLKLENGLRRGIERGELNVHYQPKVDLHNGSLYGFEALVRWDSPERGPVSPGEFIPLAEETGLIIPLGRHVLHESCRRARSWQDRYPRERPLVVSVNVSAAQLRRTDIVEEVKHALRSSNLPAHCLCLEITESVIMEDVESNLTALIRLKSLGVRIAIDDFGTGYSSLSYLKRFPVDIIKIDRSFVNRMESDGESVAIVESMLTLSHTLGLEVVAEGIETQEQAELLQSLGCEFGQGFLFSRPLPLPAVNELLTGVMLLGRSLIASS